MDIIKNINHTKNNRSSRSKKSVFIILITILVVFILSGFFISSENNSKSINKSSNSSNMAQSKQNSPGSTSTNNTSAAPITPSGTFVSSHQANSDSQELSTCNTSSGATCSITFTNSSEKKSLSAKQTDSNGAVYWSWTPSSLGLNTGSWQVSASATMNGRSVSTKDPKTLEVQ